MKYVTLDKFSATLFYDLFCGILAYLIYHVGREANRI